MRAILLLLFLFLYLLMSCVSQEPGKMEYKFTLKNSIQTEIMGHGYFYSLNYERIIFNKSLLKTAGQIGISYYPSVELTNKLWIFPVVINELISFEKHQIELGAGYIFLSESKANLLDNAATKGAGLFTGRLGYRFQRPSGRFIMRIGFTPIFDYYGIKYWGGFSFGFAF